MEKKKELGEGREGDWDCNGCRNRNYAFRSFCNRCKQPRIFVDTKTPSDSKWLPRIGDWICSGCTNNNYASREKCKKCGQPKEIAAMPAIPIPDASLQTYANYFARIQVGPRPKMSMGFMGHFGQHSVPSNPHWSFGGVDRYGLPTAANFTFGGNNRDEFLHIGDGSILQMAPKGWRSGDWICNCGFHNYSSRSQCKKCSAFPSSGGNQATRTHLMSDFFPALGTKRLASEEFSEDWDNKRLNSGDNNHFTENEKQHLYQTFEHRTGSSIEQTGTYGALNFQMHAMSPQLGKTVPTFIGKGAKQWRDGDWMCTNCNNHNFASRTHCNRCELQKDIPDQTVTVT